MERIGRSAELNGVLRDAIADVLFGERPMAAVIDKKRIAIAAKGMNRLGGLFNRWKGGAHDKTIKQSAHI